MFEGFNLLVIESPSLTADTVSNLKTQLSDVYTGNIDEIFHVFKVADISTNNTQKLIKYTHIISNTVYFPSFNAITDELMIPVLTSNWVFDSITHGKLESVRSYATDKRLIFNSCIICCSSSIADDDKRIIMDAIRCYGGVCLDTITRKVTHLITVDPKDEMCNLVNGYNKEIGRESIKIVSPDWVFSSMVLGVRQDKQESGTSVSNGDNDNKRDKFLQDKVIYLSDDFNITKRLVPLIESTIRLLSGATIGHDVAKCDYFVCLYRDGSLYEKALGLRPKLVIGNIEWIFWMLFHQKWTSPLIKLLHYPFHKKPVNGMEDVIASATNYTGDARLYIERLIEIMGGKFTKTLKSSNTHLFAAKGIGRKYEAAKHWHIKLMNHVWLEEAFSQWRFLPDEDEKYHIFPRDSDDVKIIGSTSLVDIPHISKKENITDHNSISSNESTNRAMDSEASSSPPKQVYSTKRKIASDDVSSKSTTPTTDELPKKRLKHSPKHTQESKPYNIVAIMTGCDVDLTATDNRELRRVGITMVKAPRKGINCIIAPTFLRTEKFIKTLAYSPKYIISPLFLSDILGTLDMYHRISDFDPMKPNIDNYSLSKTINFEKDRKVKALFLHPERGETYALNHLLTHSDNKLFTGFRFNISMYLTAHEPFGNIIKLFGATDHKLISKSPKSVLQNGKVGEKNPYNNVYVLLCMKKEKQLIKGFKAMVSKSAGTKYMIVEWDWIVLAIFNVCLPGDKYVLEKNF